MIRTSHILNASLISALAALGHGQRIVIADAGLPCPRGVPVIDLAVRPGLPGFIDVVVAVLRDGAFEGAILAEESATSPVFGRLTRELRSLEVRTVSHDSLKRELVEAAVIVRTGECTPFANVVLVGGTSF